MNDTQRKNAFNSKTYDRINYFIPKGKKEVIKSLAEYEGKSVNQCITEAIEGYWNIDLSK